MHTVGNEKFLSELRIMWISLALRLLSMHEKPCSIQVKQLDLTNASALYLQYSKHWLKLSFSPLRSREKAEAWLYRRQHVSETSRIFFKSYSIASNILRKIMRNVGVEKRTRETISNCDCKSTINHAKITKRKPKQGTRLKRQIRSNETSASSFFYDVVKNWLARLAQTT